MAFLVRSSYDLPTIRVVMDTATETEVVFQVVKGRAEPVDVARCATAELGLPDRLHSKMNDDQFHVPEQVLSRLRIAVDGVGGHPGEDALWLELPGPRGYLYVLPWERLLAPLGRLVLRLPNHPLRPQAPATTLQVAICASAPVAKSPFAPSQAAMVAATGWRQYAGHEVTVHLFVDHSERYLLSGNSLDGIVVHTQAEVVAHPEPPRTRRVSGGPEVANPWLLWMQEALQGNALDVVQFITHGYLSADRGAIALASTPSVNVDDELARFVGAPELSTFMSQVGAWALTLSGPPDNFCAAGQRELADTIARDNPGIVLVEQQDYGYSSSDFAQIIRTVFGGDPPPRKSLPGITCWSHPQFVQFPTGEQAGRWLTADGQSEFIRSATHAALAEDETPAWVAAGTRFLEAQQVMWLADEPDQLNRPMDPDAAAALQSVSLLLEEHARRHLGGGS